ncbi:MAG: QueT transporter family protein [Clostridia bacterium]|nr:QueT transporter family protein [Clostridia bacterium]
MKKSRVLYLTRAALVAAMYVALTWLSNFFGLASGAVQLRLSEALCVLPFFMPSSVPGLFVGCIISNLTMSANIFDIIFGSLATLIGAYIASKLKQKWLVPLPTVIANTVVVPLIIIFCYTPEVESIGAYLLVTLGVFAGEVLSAYVLGMVLLLALNKRKEIFTKKH